MRHWRTVQKYKGKLLEAERRGCPRPLNLIRVMPAEGQEPIAIVLAQIPGLPCLEKGEIHERALQ